MIVSKFIQIRPERTKQYIEDHYRWQIAFALCARYKAGNSGGAWQCSQRTCDCKVPIEKWACSQPPCSSCSQRWGSYKHLAFRRDQKKILCNWTSLFIDECWPSSSGLLKIWILNSKPPGWGSRQRCYRWNKASSLFSASWWHTAPCRPSVRKDGFMVPKGYAFWSSQCELRRQPGQLWLWCSIWEGAGRADRSCFASAVWLGHCVSSSLGLSLLICKTGNWIISVSFHIYRCDLKSRTSLFTSIAYK